MPAASEEVFNYATGPVQLSAGVLESMAGTFSSGHMAPAQDLIADTLRLVHEALELPEEFVVFLLPGSIRQALERVIRAVVDPQASVLGLSSGYWAEFLAQCAEREGVRAQSRACDDETPLPADVDVLLTAHVETEFGEVLPSDRFGREARANGATVIADLACSVPIDPLDPESFDIAILGSHKCLGGPPGLGVVAVRESAMKRLGSPSAQWDIPAYVEDAKQKYAYTRGESKQAAPPPPAVTYPIQVVAGLNAALRERTSSASYSRDLHANAARRIRGGLEEVGLVPYQGAWPLSNALVRIDVPSPLKEEDIRARLLETAGIFIIGNVGQSAGTSLRIGTMSMPQIEPANVERLVAEMTNVLGTMTTRSRETTTQAR